MPFGASGDVVVAEYPSVSVHQLQVHSTFSSVNSQGDAVLTYGKGHMVICQPIEGTDVSVPSDDVSFSNSSNDDEVVPSDDLDFDEEIQYD
jgi:hypothetical protein